MPDKSVDLVIADPWYYVDNAKIKNAFQDEVFWNITKCWVREVLRICKGHIFITFSSQTMAKFEYLLADLYTPIKSRIVWHYRNAGGRCADTRAFGKTYEMIYHIGNGDKLNFPKEWGDERFDVWHFAIPQANFKDKKVHEFQKPLALIKRLVEMGSAKGDLVLDPFVGSGTTAVAAKQLGRDYIGIELNPEYVKIAEERLAKTQLPLIGT